MKKSAPILVIFAGIFWGVMGVFVRTWGDYGFDSMKVCAIRLVTAVILLWTVLLITGKIKTRVKLRDLPLLACTGLISVFSMSALYLSTIASTSLSVAAILLYLSPVMVMLMSAMFLKERITRRKLVALVLAVAGCVFVAGLGADARVSFWGLMTGIASAIAYGSYSILGTFALRKYEPLIVTTYAFTFAAIGAVIACKPLEALHLFSVCPLGAGKIVALSFATGAVSAAIPFLLYTFGLQHMEASHAAIIVCTEPLVAALCGWIVYSEQLSVMQIAGIVLILAAIVLLNIKKKERA